MIATSVLKPSLTFELTTGISIAADHYGDPSRPPVLFLHGGGQTRHAWGGTARTLGERGYYAVTMDHRGHGGSSWSPRGAYVLENFVEDLIEVVKHFGQPPIIVGASLGGITGLTAQARADVARGLILVDTTPRMQIDGVMRIINFMKDGQAGFDSLEDAAQAIADYLPHRKRKADVSGLGKNLRFGDDGKYRWHWDPKMLESWDPKKLQRPRR